VSAGAAVKSRRTHPNGEGCNALIACFCGEPVAAGTESGAAAGAGTVRAMGFNVYLNGWNGAHPGYGRVAEGLDLTVEGNPAKIAREL